MSNIGKPQQQQVDYTSNWILNVIALSIFSLVLYSINFLVDWTDVSIVTIVWTIFISVITVDIVVSAIFRLVKLSHLKWLQYGIYIGLAIVIHTFRIKADLISFILAFHTAIQMIIKLYFKKTL